MKTRMEKWAKYREKIKNTPESKFKKKPFFVSSSEEEAAAILEKGNVSSAVTMNSLPKKRLTPYGVYLSHKRNVFIMKLILLCLAIVGMILLWLLWVRK